VFQFTGFTLMNFLTRHADVFMIGRLIGSAPLGLYSMAYRLTLYPVQALSQVVHRVAYPTLSRLRDTPESAREFYLRSLEGVTLLTFPALIGLGAVAGEFVPLALGEQWTAMVPVVQIFVWVGLLQVITATVGTIYPAMAETRLMLVLGAVNSVVVVAAFMLGIPYGIQGVALAYLAANLLMFFVQARMAWPLLGLGIGDGLSTLAPGLVASLLMGALIAGVGEVCVRQDAGAVLVLAAEFVTGLLAYPLILWLAFRRRVTVILSLLRSGRPG
jgi:PST family polysaccharide transporter